MKNYTPQERALNILSKATEQGFELNFNSTLDDLIIQADEFLIDNAHHEEEKVQITRHGNSQSVFWTDKMGFSFTQDGEIADVYKYKHGEKIVHNTVVNSLGAVVDLFHEICEEKIYRLVSHDSSHEKPRFEPYTIEEYNSQFGTHYFSVEGAVDADPEYLFTEAQMNDYIEGKGKPISKGYFYVYERGDDEYLEAFDEEDEARNFVVSENSAYGHEKFYYKYSK